MKATLEPYSLIYHEKREEQPRDQGIWCVYRDAKAIIEGLEEKLKIYEDFQRTQQAQMIGQSAQTVDMLDR